MKGPMRARKDSGSARTGKSMPQIPQRAHPPKRLLLASANARLLASLSRRLSAKGHRVCAITAPKEGPRGWSPNLYDAIVFSVDDESATLASVCEKAKEADPRLLLVVLSTGPFQMESRAVPDVVIAGKNEAAIAERLLAILNSRVPDAA